MGLFPRAQDPDNQSRDADDAGNNNEAMCKRRSEDGNDGAVEYIYVESEMHTRQSKRYVQRRHVGYHTRSH